MWPGHMWNGGFFGWGGMLIGGLITLLFWAVIIALAFFAIRAIARSSSPRDGRGPVERRPQTPLEILQERYARGEITREQYQEMRRDLET